MRNGPLSLDWPRTIVLNPDGTVHLNEDTIKAIAAAVVDAIKSTPSDEVLNADMLRRAREQMWNGWYLTTGGWRLPND
jgi:hypothetical protein